MGINIKSQSHNAWLAHILKSLPTGVRIHDDGVGQFLNKVLCACIDCISQAFYRYDGKDDFLSLQASIWDTSKINFAFDISCILKADC